MLWLQNQGISGMYQVTATLCLTLLGAMMSWHAVEKHALQLKDWCMTGSAI